MKRNGLRALGLATCAVLMVSLIGLAVDVNYIVSRELIDEINLAAGLALVGEYTLKTVEELEDLAANGLTPGIRLAAESLSISGNQGTRTTDEGRSPPSQ